jgi:DNA-binding transcriptional MerR regulator
VTVREAAERLGIAEVTMWYWTREAGLRKTVVRNRHRVYDLSEDDLRRVQAFRRRRHHIKADKAAVRMKRMELETRETRMLNRDPEEWRRSIQKAVKAAAGKRRRLREWRERHDTDTYRRLPNPTAGELHPWRASIEADIRRRDGEEGDDG